MWRIVAALPGEHLARRRERRDRGVAVHVRRRRCAGRERHDLGHRHPRRVRDPRANDDLVFVQLIAAQAPIGVAFSADGAEMFVSGHLTVDLLQRYNDAGSDTWTPSGTMDLGSSLGGLALVPG